MAELGLRDEFLELPHQKATTVGAYFGDREYAFADFTHLPTRAKFVTLMPQWDFLNFLAAHGKRYPSFHLALHAEAVDLIEDGGRVIGVRANTPDGALEVRADLTVGCDGRPLEAGTLRADDLAAVQERREFPTRVTQRMQVFMQNKVIDVALGAGTLGSPCWPLASLAGADKALRAPLALRLMSRFAWLRRIPARLIGMGVRPEHVHTPDMRAAAGSRGA